MKILFSVISIALFAISSGHLVQRARESVIARVSAGLLAIVLAIMTFLPFTTLDILPWPFSQRQVSLDGKAMNIVSRNTNLTPMIQESLGGKALGTDGVCGAASFTVIAVQTKCGFRLGAQGELFLDERIVSPRLVTTFSSDDSTESAIQVYIFPEPKRKRYFVIQGCDKQLCWSVWKFDRKHWTLVKTSAGKYGPARWIRWSSDSEVAIMFNSNDGGYWLHSIYFPENLRDGSSTVMLGIEPYSFEWLGERRFLIDARLRGESDLKTHEFLISRKSIDLIR